jgi:hypothetical protein
LLQDAACFIHFRVTVPESVEDPLVFPWILMISSDGIVSDDYVEMWQMMRMEVWRMMILILAMIFSQTSLLIKNG